MKKITSNSFIKQNTINKKIIKLITFVVLLLTSLNTYSQNNVGIGTTTPNSKAILELQATDKGFIAPRMTGAQMLAIPVTAVESALLIYNTDSSCYHFYNGMAWKNLCNNNLDTALINKAIKNYLSSNSTTIINILKGDTALFNYVTINNANINTLTVDTNITNVAIINSADIKILKVDSSVTNYAEIKNLQGGWASMDSLKIGGKNIMTTISDSIAAQAWLLKGNNTTATNKLGTLNAQDLHIVANNVEAITINNGTRNVGISQPLPAEKLDVTGNIKFTGALKPAGLAGNANEVLSSTGASTAPIWQPMSAILNSTITTNMNVVKIDSSAINYADINILKGDSANLNYLSVGGQNIMQTMTDSIASQAWLLKGNIGTNPNSNFIGTIDNKSLRFRTKNTEKMIIDSLGIVGLGISTPLSKLHIVGIGTSLYNNGLTVQSPNAIQSLDVLPGFALTNSTPSGIQEDITMTLRSSGSLFGNMAFATGNEERMRLTTIGRFGIGTSIPNAKLSLETFGNDGFTMGQNIGATPNGGDFSIYSTGASNPGYGQFIQSNWQYVSALNQYAKAGGASRITMINADYIGFQNIGNVNAGDIILQTAPAGVAGASIPYVNTLALKATGNVGIGTVNPINRLNVTADGTIKPVYDSNEQFQFHGNAQMYGTVSSDFQTFGFGVNGPAGSIISTHGAWIGSLTNDRLNFRTNNVEQMVITNLGNVGIGTTSPAAKLDVRGNILAVNGGLFSSVASTNGIQGLVELKGSYSTSSRPNLNSWTLYNMNEYGGVESGLSIWEYYDVDNNGSYCNPGDICQSRFHIQNVTGNVGIGKVTPTQKLDVYGSVLSQTSTAQSALLSSDGNLELQRDITSPVPSVGGYVDLKTNFLEDFRTRLYYNNFNGSFNIATTTDGFSTTGSERLTILASNGFTGLGILNPTEKLHVIGNILASGVITPSDARYKQNIVTLNNSLNNVLKLRGVTYDMKAEYKDKGFGTGTQIGVIAQELEAVYPQLINTSSDGYKSVDYSKFAPILIEAIKDLNTKHDNDIQQLNAKHTEQLNTLLKRIEALEKK